MARISVFGLGYVGCVGVGCFAKLGHTVIGYDIDPVKTEKIAKGFPTIVEREIDEILQEGFLESRISATNSVDFAIQNSDISFICVGTPNASDGGLDTSYLLSAIRAIGKALLSKQTFHVLVIRSTVPPGTNQKATHILEEISGKRDGIDFAVVSNPEFLREGIAVSDFLNPPMTVLGSENKKALKMLHEVYDGLNSEIVEVPCKVAEIIKFINNSYHALKVAFGNEVGSICKKLNIDSHQVMDLFCRDKQLNISPYYFKPGFAYGGSCLPKDLKGLNYLAKINQVDVPILSSISTSNFVHIQRVIEHIQNSKHRSIGLIGLTFKAGTDDLRNSAAIKLAETILGKCCTLSIYDRFLNIAKERKTNLNEMKMIPHLVPLLESSVENVIKKSSLVIITVRNSELLTLISKYPKVHFLDLVRLKDNSVEQLPNYEGICW